jgi:hypothetical protein
MRAFRIEPSTFAVTVKTDHKGMAQVAFEKGKMVCLR